MNMYYFRLQSPWDILRNVGWDSCCFYEFLLKSVQTVVDPDPSLPAGTWWL